jgi:hypothetical protein
MTTQTMPLPHSETSNGGKKTICQPFYSPDVTSADFFLIFLRVKSGWALVVPGELQDDPVAGCPKIIEVLTLNISSCKFYLILMSLSPIYDPHPPAHTVIAVK